MLQKRIKPSRRSPRNLCHFYAVGSPNWWQYLDGKMVRNSRGCRVYRVPEVLSDHFNWVSLRICQDSERRKLQWWGLENRVGWKKFASSRLCNLWIKTIGSPQSSFQSDPWVRLLSSYIYIYHMYVHIIHIWSYIYVIIYIWLPFLKMCYVES